MNHVFARLTRQRKNLFNVLSDNQLFKDINFDDIDVIAYTPDHNLDEDSWFKIEKFSEQDYFPEFLKDDLDSKYFKNISKEDYKKIKLLISSQNGDLYFQKVIPSFILKKKGFLSFGESVEFQQYENMITINELPNAIYFSDKNILIFKDLSTISSIFKGIDELYREATDEEVTKFLEQDFILLANGFLADKVSKPNRKRIALATQSFNKMSEQERKDILEYIQEYCDDEITLKYDWEAKKFCIENDTQLKYLIYGIEQRFFQTLVGKEKRVANSIIPIK